ncbi:DUF1254 domain-containing protein [Paraburkholderia gardini]|nr:DUF1254 domain-containing protein [Paraburkholderia gardini]
MNSILVACAMRGNAGQPVADAYQFGYRAYLYGFPTICLTRLSYRRMAIGDPVTGEHHRWGVRAFRDHFITLAVVGAPQTDTLYSNAWIDRTREPHLLEIPHIDGRYRSMQCCDFFGTTFDLPSRRTAPEETVVALPGLVPATTA